MKTSFILIIMLIISSFHFIIAQDRFPSQRELKYDGENSTKFKSTDTNFNFPGKMLIGYHWTNESNISKAILATQNNVFAQYMNYTDTTIPDSNLIQPNALLFVEGVDSFYKEGVYSHVLGDTGILNARYMSFKPNMKINPGDNQYAILAKRPFDTTNPIFGFKYVDPNALANNVNDSGDVNYGCLLIDNQSFINDTIFKGPWGIDYLRKHPVDTIKVYKAEQRDFYGYNFIVSVNVKRLDTNYFEEMSSSPVLTIKLAYELHNGTKDFINFEYLPNICVNDIKSSYDEFRGRQPGCTVIGGTTSFRILGTHIEKIGEMVTLSAKFRCWGLTDNNDPGLPYYRNPRLSSLSGIDQTEIKKLDIIAIYNGVCPIGIESVFITTPQGKKLYEGKFDTKICNYIQNDINCVNRYASVTTKHPKIFRFTDVTEAGPQYYGAMCYINRLLGDVFTGSNGPCLPVLFQHYVKPADMIVQLFKIYTCVNAPYVNPTSFDTVTHYRKLGFMSGREQRLATDPVRLTTDEQLNSVYETYYPKNNATGQYFTYNDFKNHDNDVPRIYELKWKDGYGNSFQAFHQYNIWNSFYNDTCSGFQYGNIPWYGQIHNLIEWRPYKKYFTGPNDPERNQFIDVDKKNKLFIFQENDTNKAYIGINITQMNSYVRPPTAEESRIYGFFQLLQGARGLFYDGLSYLKIGPFSRYAHNKPLIKNPLMGEDTNDNFYNYLMKEELGGDFLNYNTEADDGNDLFFESFKTLFPHLLKDNIDEVPMIENSLGCKVNRIYLGRKSVRTEYYKIHRLIFDNNDAFMSHKLLAYYGKGYIKLYNQHPSYPLTSTDTLLDKYVDISKITTRKIFQPNSNLLDTIYTTVPYSTVEPESEQFYDLSLLQCGTENIKYHHRLAIQNRRTDPLRLFKTRDIDNLREICFLTAAEMDSLADNGGVNPFDKNPTKIFQDTGYWRDMYRKQFGSREISLPIRRLRELTDSWGYLVKDLTYKYPKELSTMKYWMKDAYDHQIYQFVGSTIYKSAKYDTINCKLRAGEAKFLDIKRFYKVNDIQADIIRKIPPPSFPPPPPPPTTPLDTCDELQRGSGMFFTRVDTSDGNSCIYDIYYYNKSDSCNFYVPISAEFITDNNKDTTYLIDIGFQYLNIKKLGKFQSIWLPDSVLTGTKHLGRYRATCDSSKVIFRIGARDCFSTDTIFLPCHICECSDSLKINLAPINPFTMCKVIPLISQTTTLSNGEDCKYYGLDVTGGFSPNDVNMIPDLCVFPDTLNPQPIDFSTYNKYVDNPFMNIFCPNVCSYYLHFSFKDIYSNVLTIKDFSITFDNTQLPVEIEPSGLVSSQCYSIQPAKRAIPSEEVYLGQMLFIEPNPTSGKANVRLNLEQDLVGRLVLYTGNGELIKEIATGKFNKGNSNYGIDLSSQPSGMYIITIESDGMQYIKKFVKE